jgi:hypothetical protein
MTGTAETLAQAVHVPSNGLPPGVTHAKFVSIMGVSALVRYRLDEHEVARRADSRLGALSSPDVLNLLLDLPLGLPVPVASLTTWERSALRGMPRGAVSITKGEVTREAVAPVVVDLAIVPARTWRTGLHDAGRFAPFCARLMVLGKPPKDLAELNRQAGFYGIGVAVADGAEPQLLVAPEPFRRLRFTVASWQFLEHVYRQVAGAH